MNCVFLSIIVPVYNVEPYLEDCLNSILNQKYRDIEVICVNDPSPDGSSLILERYEKQYDNVTVITREKKLGLSSARNTGLKQAKGKYVWFVDSDDLLAEGSLEEVAQSLAASSLDILYFNMKMRDEGKWAKEQICLSQEYSEYKGIYSGQELFVKLMKNKEIKIEVWRQVFRREFLIENGLYFYEGIVCEDLLFSVLCAVKAKKVRNINRNLYIYRRRDNSLNTTLNINRLHSLNIVCSELYVMWKTEKLTREMQMALWEYLQTLTNAIKKNAAYYPEYKDIRTDALPARFLFSLIVNNKEYKYIRIGEEQRKFIRGWKRIYLYGAGTVALEVIHYLKTYSMDVEKILVSDKQINADCVEGIPIVQCEEKSVEDDDVLVIVAVTKKYQSQIADRLRDKGYANILQLDTLT